MSRVQLEVFQLAVPTPASDIVVLGKMELEETRLSAFDKGYAAGWEDATAALTTDRSRMEAELGRNLQALGFTFQEARVHLLRGLKPLLTTMIGRLLPEMARETLCALILEQLMPHAEAAVDAPVSIIAHPRARPFLEGILTQAQGLPLKIAEDADLPQGQVFLRFAGGDETLIDLDRAIGQIMATVRDFFAHTDEERAYG
jgi:flagellar assembly protein FliH